MIGDTKTPNTHALHTHPLIYGGIHHPCERMSAYWVCFGE
jgi:hypothetical protein